MNLGRLLSILRNPSIATQSNACKHFACKSSDMSRDWGARLLHQIHANDSASTERLIKFTEAKVGRAFRSKVLAMVVWEKNFGWKPKPRCVTARASSGSHSTLRKAGFSAFALLPIVDDVQQQFPNFCLASVVQNLIAVNFGDVKDVRDLVEVRVDFGKVQDDLQTQQRR